MIREFEQYRFARIEGRNVTRARLQSQFKDGINDLDELEKAIALELGMESPCAPWRRRYDRVLDTRTSGVSFSSPRSLLDVWWGCLGLGFGFEGLLVRFVRTRGGLLSDEEAIVRGMIRVWWRSSL